MKRSERLKREKASRASKTSSIKWKLAREKFAQMCKEGYEPAPGELANMIDGLTPDGYDKRGVKVSFIERGVKKTGKRISTKPVIISK